MSRNSDFLLEILDSDSTITAAWFDDPNYPRDLHIAHTGTVIPTVLPLRNELGNLRTILHPGQPLKILVCPATAVDHSNIHQQCQDEPIQLGCQCQPQAANWVGTAGAPVTWKSPEGKRLYGILSNWHVLAAGQERAGRTIHQPQISRPTFATLANWQRVSPNSPNLFDAAIADALIGDYHSISSSVLELGPLDPRPIRAQVGLVVSKSGRTTGLTSAICSAIGAAVRVGYGDFTATFEDQDVFTSVDGFFSAPGDSGSLIVDTVDHRPVALLFAGSPELTIGNPIRHIIDHFGLDFNLRL